MRADLYRKQEYIDNELGPHDADEFERNLSEDELRELQEEKNLNMAMRRRISSCPGCPDELWNKLKTQMLDDDLGPLERRQPRRRTVHVLLAAVAVLAIYLGAAVYLTPEESNPIPAGLTFDVDIEQFGRFAAFHGNRQAIVRDLDKHGFHSLVFDSTDRAKHPLKVLGVSYVQIDGREIAQIFFVCCGHPMLALVAPDDAEIDLTHVRNSDADVSTKRVGRYRISVAGKHDADEVLALFH